MGKAPRSLKELSERLSARLGESLDRARAGSVVDLDVLRSHYEKRVAEALERHELKVEIDEKSPGVVTVLLVEKPIRSFACFVHLDPKTKP